MQISRKKAIELGASLLSLAGIYNPKYEAELLFSETAKISRIDILKDYSSPVDSLTLEKFADYILKRATRLPIQYILKKVNFMGFEFYVNRNVFIPRPETEILVEETLRIMRGLNKKTIRVLDIGVGSGNIAISIIKLNPTCRVTATDISKKALLVAKRNANKCKVSDRVKFLHANIFPKMKMRFDVIVSNPPYVAESKDEKIDAEILSEPGIAIWGGRDGLDFIKKILSHAHHYLNKNGYLLIEIGWKHSKKIKSLVKNFLHLKLCGFKKDYSGIERVAIFTIKEKPRF